MLHHAALEVAEAQLGEEVAFWGLLGFVPVEPPEALRGRTTWVQRGDHQVHLLRAEDPVVPPEGHLAVVAQDFEADVAALRAAGHDVQDRAAHWGAARAFATSPAGHRVEVMAAPPS